MSDSLYYSAKAVAVGPRSSKSEKDETGMPHTIEQQIKATYFALRAGAALIAFVFPLLLWGGGKLAGFTLRDSMSAYYWATPTQLCPCGDNPDGTCIKKATKAEVSLKPTPREQALEPGTMRTWFVGLLSAIGIVLYVNQGHSKMEDLFLNLAGLLAWGIAIFPMNWDCFHHSFSPHGFCAMSFFICIAIISAFFSRNTLVLIKDPKVRARYRLTYQVIGVLMFASPLAAYGFNFITSQHSPVYWAELMGIWAFAAYWVVKTKEMQGPDIAKLIAEKGLKAVI
jgi:hypothetical membrane protein